MECAPTWKQYRNKIKPSVSSVGKNCDLDINIAAYLNNFGFILATSALERVLLEICNGNQTTALTDMNPISITLVEQPFFQEVGCPMSNHAVPFHFSKTETTITRSPLSRLPSKDLHWTSPSGVDLIIHHVLKPLVVSGAQEYHSSQSSACMTIIHSLKTTHLITTFVECFTDIVHLKV